jgi:hypothetical protein
MKNHVADETGWHAYLMLTEACLDHLHLSLEDTHSQVESYEHLGDVQTYSLDLHKRYDEIARQRQIFLTRETADLVFTVDFPVPPHVAWEWIQSPEKRNLVQPGVHWFAGDRPRGRSGAGARNHCAHGGSESTEVTLDWHPFEYSTSESHDKGRKMYTETDRFEALPNGCTRMHVLVLLNLPLPRFVRRVLVKRILLDRYHYDRMLMDTAKQAGEQYPAAADRE